MRKKGKRKVNYHKKRWVEVSARGVMHFQWSKVSVLIYRYICSVFLRLLVLMLSRQLMQLLLHLQIIAAYMRLVPCADTWSSWIELDERSTVPVVSPLPPDHPQFCNIWWLPRSSPRHQFVLQVNARYWLNSCLIFDVARSRCIGRVVPQKHPQNQTTIQSPTLNRWIGQMLPWLP